MLLTPQGSETGKSLAQVLRLVMEGLMEETFAEVCADGIEVTAAQFEVLRFIDRHERPTIGDVAEGLKTSSAAATKAVAGLVERPEPLVARSRGTDRRTVRLETTLAGHRLVKRIRESFTARLDAILDRMAPDERDALARGLHGFLEAALVRPTDCDAACLRCGIDHSDDCLVHLAEVSIQGRRVTRC